MVTEVWYPPGTESKAGKKYLEVMKKYPDDKSISTPVVPFMVNTTRNGTHTMSIYQVKRGMWEKATDLATKRMLEFSVIEGIRYEIRSYLTAPEAMANINLEMPA